MASDSVTRCTGLVLQFNPLQTAPGALVQADNVVIDRENVVEDRRGYALYFALGSAGAQTFVYSNKILCHNGTLITYDNGGSGANYAGTYNAPTGKKMRAVEAFQNLYVTTDQGVQVFTDVVGTQARKAGSPRPLDITASAFSSAGSMLPAGNNCAYRSVVKRIDANSNVILSYPSNRTIVSNPTVVTTGTIANGSTSLSSLAVTTGVQSGMSVTGAGIPAGTTVGAPSGGAVTMSQAAVVTTYTTTANTTNGSNQLSSVVSTLGLVPGQVVSGTGIPTGTTVLSINSVTSGGTTTTDITLSANATATGTAVSLTFSPAVTLVPVTFGWAANPTLKCYLPAEAATTDLIQVYRTASTYGIGTDPGEEMALVYQVAPSSTDISNGFITFTDVLIDALRGASLYTSPSQLNISGANDRPPVCKDMALYKNNYLLFANASTKQRFSFTLISAGSLSGRTVKIAGTTYNFASSENTATGTAAVGATGITASDIESTARSLVKVINLYASNTSVYAYYQSGPQDPPGKIMIEERGIGASAFTFQSGDSTIAGQFSPQPPVSPGTSTLCTSTNQIQKNAIYFSQYQQPEAVPLLNYVLAGAANKEILRIAPLRNSLIIIKEEGVYRMSGDTPQNFVVTPLDLTVRCASPESVAVLANTVIMLSNQGVVQITETAVQVISREIEPAIKPLLSFSNISTLALALSCETDRAYFLSVPSVSADTAPNQIYRFNIFTRAWTRWGFGFTCGVHEPSTDKIFFCQSGDTNLYRERKSYTDSDYADPESTISISAFDLVANTVTLTTSGPAPQPGWAITQGALIELAILSVTAAAGGSYVVTCLDAIPPSLAAGSATLFPSVGAQWMWDVWTSEGAAGLLKQVSEAAILADNIPGANSASGITPLFRSNFDDEVEAVTLTPSNTGWGSGWGAISWGGQGTYGYRTYVPRNKQVCSLLNVGVRHQNALERFSCSGYALSFRVIGERIGK